MVIHAYRIALLSITCVLCSGSPAVAFVYTSFSPSTWPRSDATIGVSGFIIEDFEDVGLTSGLAFHFITEDGSHSYGPSNLLPATFDPTTDDPVGTVFVNGVWDGSKTLVNAPNNQPISYGNLQSFYGDVTFSFEGGATSVGLSLQQVELAGTSLRVNGVLIGVLGAVGPNLGLTGTRNGYLRIDAEPGEVIQSIALDTPPDVDGFSIDHLAFQPVPSTVPSLGTYGVILLVSSFTVVARLNLRRQRMLPAGTTCPTEGRTGWWSCRRPTKR